MEKTKSPEEQTVLKDQIDDVTDRWNKARKETETRRKKIDKLKKPSKFFSEKEQEFVVTLKKLEKRSKEQDIIPVDTQEAHAATKVTDVSIVFHALKYRIIVPPPLSLLILHFSNITYIIKICV